MKKGFWSTGSSPTLVYRVLVAALIVSTSVGTWYATTNRAAFELGFPGAANPTVYAAMLVTGGLSLVALVGLWGWRRWAVGLYGVLVVAGIVLDLVAHGPVLHLLTVVVAAVVLSGLIYRNRGRFGLGH